MKRTLQLDECRGVAITFRPLQRADFPVLQRWLAEAHVEQWWRLPFSESGIEAHFGPRVDRHEPTFVYIVEIDQRPLGLAQWYRWADYPEHGARLGVGKHDAGIDLAIGEPDYLGRGLGPAIIRTFLADCVWASDDVTACVADPEVANRRSIRAFEKAGFLAERVVNGRSVMRLGRHGPTALGHWGISFAAGEALNLTVTAQAASEVLMRRLPERSEGKMFGVMVVETPGGPAILQAFSGMLDGQANLPLWVPALTSPEPLAGEAETVQRLDDIKRELSQLACSDVFDELRASEAAWKRMAAAMLAAHQAARSLRKVARQVPGCHHRLDEESRAERRARRELQRSMEFSLAPLHERRDTMMLRAQALKHERKQLSRALQAQMHARSSLPLASLFPNGPPTGVGECCAPKLLHFAVTHGYRPVGLAEFWHGPPPPGGGRVAGHFYAACAERCQPLLAPMLAALQEGVKILYQDETLVAVDKPPGLLTVPGRRSYNQDSLLTRVQAVFPQALPVHRLDLETSGVVLFALDRSAQSRLQRQFASRRASKVYEALLETAPACPEGRLEEPLASDPDRRGCYRVSADGKPALTEYRMLRFNRAEFRPRTGRSHQLRVHAATVLGCPIVGDPLYGTSGPRLMLHARTLEISHPVDGRPVCVHSNPPF